MTTRLTRLTQKVRELRGERLTSLMGMLFDPEGLRSSFERQEERKAPGVDGVRSSLRLSPSHRKSSSNLMRLILSASRSPRDLCDERHFTFLRN